ncbi:sulfate permease [Microthyrium microscopicum]|uniref:Sulfate permease n=1 Tax=Microthyrium microscopicum TaxID=703497 RepID=A0A6A6UQ34_9PEZI|nr:sulfate permease [Microthyrium microscopicum]
MVNAAPGFRQRFILFLEDHLNENKDPNYHYRRGGESIYSVSTADGYIEEEPTVKEYLKEITPTGKEVLGYFSGLFPFIHWITRYNLQWLAGDLIAGITVAAVVVPQSMAYAKLANLAPEFGLYSSFMGVIIYWFFATSKDITIGPVAVLSTLVGTVVTDVQKHNPKIQGYVIASALAVISGAVVTFMGLIRIGWIVDFISLTAIAAFMTGSAINIAVGQIPTLMGITGFNTRDSTYKVVINILKHLGRTKLDAAMGLTALTMLYVIRIGCSQASKRWPRKQKIFFFLSTLRTVFVILLYTMISWLVNRHHKKKPSFVILGTVPRGFQHAGKPFIDKHLISAFAGHLPSTIIVMLIEHISISKSFGRVNNYQINPSQELVAMGVTNLLGPFLGAYPATGSFSRTAIKSKAGVRTPLAGVITGLVVLIAIYALTSVFFYISSAALAAVIIHAVGDLITSPKTLYKFWKISPLEVPIFLVGVFVTVFSSIENGIYCTIIISAVLLVFRLAKARGRFLGRVKIHSVVGEPGSAEHLQSKGEFASTSVVSAFEDSKATRNAFLPIDHHDGSNPLIEPVAPYPGVFIFRFSEGYNYPNCFHYLDYLTKYIFDNTQRTNPQAFPRLGDRPWNDPGPRRGKSLPVNNNPHLKAIILDFSSVNNVDVTSVQNLIDVRNQLDRYTAPETVEWHFASINNRWTKRALAAAGFGYINEPTESGERHVWKPIFSVAEIGGDDSAAHAAQEIERRNTVSNDPETGFKSHANGATVGKVAAVHGVNRPLFHVDLTSAVQSAIHSARNRPQAQVEFGTPSPQTEAEAELK